MFWIFVELFVCWLNISLDRRDMRYNFIRATHIGILAKLGDQLVQIVKEVWTAEMKTRVVICPSLLLRL